MCVCWVGVAYIVVVVVLVSWAISSHDFRLLLGTYFL